MVFFKECSIFWPSSKNIKLLPNIRYNGTKNKIVNSNEKLNKYKYIYTLRRDLIICFVDIMRQTLKSKQRKQIFCFLLHINRPSKRLLEWMNLIEVDIILLFVLLSYLPSPYRSNFEKDFLCGVRWINFHQFIHETYAKDREVLAAQKKMGSWFWF